MQWCTMEDRRISRCSFHVGGEQTCLEASGLFPRSFCNIRMLIRGTGDRKAAWLMLPISSGTDKNSRAADRRSHRSRIRPDRKARRAAGSDKYGSHKGSTRGRRSDLSENGRHAARSNKVQVGRIGGIARQSECLASSRRRSLPGHVILEGGQIDSSVRRGDLKDHSHQPRADRRKWKFFGLNNSRDTSMIAGRRLCRRCGRKHRG